MQYRFLKISLILFSLPLLSVCIVSAQNYGSTANEVNKLTTAGLITQVEVIRDKWGINHIYAQNEHDLFFAQGYCAAKDRLFQFEVWRRQATGTCAELFGTRELKRDIGTRLFQYRGDLNKDLEKYHPRGVAIIQAYVQGVNAYIKQVKQNPNLLPLEFSLLKIQPGEWTPAVVISRHQGLLGNITQELNKDILALYNAYRKDLIFQPSDIGEKGDDAVMNSITFPEPDLFLQAQEREGSNNWIISGKKSVSGYPLLANDPHRKIAVPSLRYMVHLVAPGWNVI